MSTINEGEGHFSFDSELLPETLPTDPFPIFQHWYDQAVSNKIQRNPNGMYLCTVGPDARPSCRTVLCKILVPDPGYIVFFTNYESRKGREITGNSEVSILFHWDAMERQVRIEGPAIRSPQAESDEYFASRRWESRVGAWASKQSEPIESQDALMLQVFETVEQLGLDTAELVNAGPDAKVDIPRPPHWGGLRVFPRSVELWCANETRLHDRARWTRELVETKSGIAPAQWSATRLQP